MATVPLPPDRTAHRAFIDALAEWYWVYARRAATWHLRRPWYRHLPPEPWPLP
jgi:hypothetical protein